MRGVDERGRSGGIRRDITACRREGTSARCASRRAPPSRCTIRLTGMTGRQFGVRLSIVCLTGENGFHGCWSRGQRHTLRPRGSSCPGTPRLCGSKWCVVAKCLGSRSRYVVLDLHILATRLAGRHLDNDLRRQRDRRNLHRAPCIVHRNPPEDHLREVISSLRVNRESSLSGETAAVRVSRRGPDFRASGED